MTELTEGDIFRGLITVAAPIVAGNVLQSGLELVDLFFVGRLGSEAIAGVAMSTSIVMVLMTVIIGIVTANTAFVSRYYGARDTRKPMYATLISMILFQIPLACILPEFLGIGIAGVWIAVICGAVLQTGILFSMYRHGGWKTTVI